MVVQKKWIDLLGKPQGNEMLWDNEIVRKVGDIEFVTLWRTSSKDHAVRIFEQWMKESEWSD